MLKLIHFFLIACSSICLANEDVYKITKNLKCIVCDGQSVYDSESSFAEDVKALTHKMYNSGLSHDEIMDKLIQIYGEEISYKPPLTTKTMPLYLFPITVFALIILIGMKELNSGDRNE